LRRSEGFGGTFYDCPAGINELGLEWLIARAAQLRAKGDCAAQVLTALGGAEVKMLASKNELGAPSKSDVICALRSYEAVVVSAAAIELPFMSEDEALIGCLLVVDLEDRHSLVGVSYVFGRLGIWLWSDKGKAAERAG